jgi:hypothetical protein
MEDSPPESWGVCDRSGLKTPRSQLVREPGTNLYVRRSELDGYYNYVKHPQNKAPHKRVEVALRRTSPDVDVSYSNFLLLEDGGCFLTEMYGGEKVLLS